MNITETPFFIPLKLSNEVCDYARNFAAEQLTVEKSKQVYLNTLAVGAVCSYLEWMEFATNLSKSESWHPVIRRLNDVADLFLPDLGRLECRPIWPGETVVFLPAEVTEDRIGCVVVQFEEENELERVKLLGFYRAMNNGELPETILVSQLQSCEEMIEYFEALAIATSPVAVSLSQWLQGLYDDTWQTLSVLFQLYSPDLALQFRQANVSEDSDSTSSQAGVKRGKAIRLGVTGENDVSLDFFLLVEIVPEAEEQMCICVQIYPAMNHRYLPANLHLILLNKLGSSIMETCSRDVDNYIQLKFRGSPGEDFSIRVVIAEASVTEQFII